MRMRLGLQSLRQTSTPTPTPSVVNDRILYFGDSITAAPNSFANLFGTDHPLVSNNLNAVAGTSINTGANSFMSRQAAGLALNAEALVVLAGANDLSDTGAYATTTAWMTALYNFTDPFRAAGTKVYIIPPLPQGTSYPGSATHNSRRATVRTTLLADVGTRIDGVVDHNIPDADANDTNKFSDGLHPTDAEHVTIYATSRPSSRTALGLGTWTPAEWIYPGGAVDGYFYDYGLISSLDQAVGGGTPVVSANDPIGKVTDLSGRGYNNFRVANDANRPLYKTNGGAGGTSAYADFDGSNDEMATSSFAAKGQPNFWMAAIRLNSTAANQRPMDGIANGSRNSILIAAGGGVYLYAGQSHEDSGLTVSTSDVVIGAGFNNASSFGQKDQTTGATVSNPIGSNSLTGITSGSSYVPAEYCGHKRYREIATLGSIPNSRVRGFMVTWLAAGQGRTL